MFEDNFSSSQIAISLSHFYAYKQISNNCEFALILEDDVILGDFFLEILHLYISQLPADYDMLFIGDGCNLHFPGELLIPGSYVYKKTAEPTEWGGQGVTRCTDSYIVTKKCATKLCNYIQNISYKPSGILLDVSSALLPKKINDPIDWWLNVAAKDTDLNVYWAEPNIVTQGTQNSLFTTSHDI